MRLPLIAPNSDQNLGTIHGYLTRVRNDLSNLGSGDASKVLSDYQQWVSASSETLGYAFDQDAIDTLVLTRRCWALMDTYRLFGEADNGPVIHKTISAEKTDRLRVLDALISKYRELQKWGEAPGKFVLPDTNFFATYDVIFSEVDWVNIGVAIEHEPVRVIIPIAVVRELDRLKIAGRNVKIGKDKSEDISGRARRTIRMLKDMFSEPDELAAGTGSVKYELMQDPLAHRPNSSVDAEIIDRMLVVKRVSGKSISLVTRDLGMKLTAAAEGIKVLDRI